MTLCSLLENSIETADWRFQVDKPEDNQKRFPCYWEDSSYSADQVANGRKIVGGLVSNSSGLP